MKRIPNHNPKVNCGSCRRFDGLVWCKQWNQPTSADAPPCPSYLVRRRAVIGDSADVFPESPDGPRDPAAPGPAPLPTA